MLPAPTELAIFMTAAVLLNLTPGPDMLYVLTRSVGEGRRAGIISAFAISTGILLHVTAVALGLSTLLERAPAVFTIVQTAGGLYLIWLGVRAFLRSGPIEGGDKPAPSPPAEIFRQGVLTCLLNPKVALFFLAFLPQFVDPWRGNTQAQVFFLGICFITSGTLVNLAVAVGASRLTAAVRAHGQRREKILSRLTGVVFMALGLRLLFLKRA